MKYKFFNFILIVIIIFIFIREDYFNKAYRKCFNEKPTQLNVISSTYYWSQKNNIYQGFNCKNKIVFLGSSIIDDIELNELFGRSDIVNRGIGGDITYGILKRIDQYLIQKPKCIFLKIGVNDIFWGFDILTIKLNYLQIINRIVEKKIPLYILSTNQTSEKFKEYQRINLEVKQLNNYLILVAKNFNSTYIDLNINLTDSNGLKNEFTPDGIHLNFKGYLTLKNSIDPFINRIN